MHGGDQIWRETADFTFGNESVGCVVGRSRLKRANRWTYK